MASKKVNAEPGPRALREARAQDSAVKKDRVADVLKEMLDNKEPVMVSEVRRRAGVSQWFLYNGGNGEVRRMMDDARLRSMTDLNDSLQQVAGEMSSTPLGDNDLNQIMLRLESIEDYVAVTAMHAEQVRDMLYDANSDGRVIHSLIDASDKLGGIGVDEVTELINSGELTQLRIGRADYVTTRSLIAYIARQSPDGQTR